MDLTDPTLIIFAKLTIASFLGVLVGIERVAAGKGAGMRTFAMVSMGSCLFVIVGIEASRQYLGIVNFDPTRVLASIVQGIGFLGAGLIIMREDHVFGLTTAAALWTAAAIGACVGFGLWAIAVFATVLTLFIFTALWFFEETIRRWTADGNQHSKSTL